MDIAVISIILANMISILTLAVSIIIQVIENKKDRYVTKITTETIAHNTMVQECSVVILSLTNPIRLATTTSLSSEERDSLITAISKLEMHFVIVIKQEVDLLISIRKLVNAYMKYLSDPTTEQREKVIQLREDYYWLISIYNYADWRYIKAQIRGQKDVKDFEIYYKEQMEAFQASKPHINLPDWETVLKNKKE